ncbi:MAG TPA: hypothetical protein VNA16_03125 [Abditibacteriaceae bacterium]|nr:hypothetical protein [Abditibacteriaceae bacterium]
MRYLKAAFFAKSSGRLPLNALGVLAFLALGFWHPAFWLVGLGLEAIYLFGLTSNERFRKWVDAQKYMQPVHQAGSQEQLLSQLGPESRSRMRAMENKCEKIFQAYAAHMDSFVAENNRDALNRLLEVYLKLLVVRRQLLAVDRQAMRQSVQNEIAALESDLGSTASGSLHESKTATLEILRQRLENSQQGEQALNEVESDLQRIEAQIDLAREQALHQERPPAISLSINLATQLLDGGVENILENIPSRATETTAGSTQSARRNPAEKEQA